MQSDAGNKTELAKQPWLQREADPTQYQANKTETCCSSSSKERPWSSGGQHMTCVSIPGRRSQHWILPIKSSGLISPEDFKLIFSVYLTTNYTKLLSWLYTNFNSHAFCSSVNQRPPTFQEQPSSDYRAFISC